MVNRFTPIRTLAPEHQGDVTMPACYTVRSKCFQFIISSPGADNHFIFQGENYETARCILVPGR